MSKEDIKIYEDNSNTTSYDQALISENESLRYALANV
jgi:hypothetical protein